VITLVVIDRLGAVASAHYYLPAQIARRGGDGDWSIDRSFLVTSTIDTNLRRHAKSGVARGPGRLGREYPLWRDFRAGDLEDIWRQLRGPPGRPCCA